jgi:hypothetical protein
MAKKNLLTFSLALFGALLAWFPLLATVFTSAAVTIRSRIFHIDFLMPAELFPVAFVGGGLLLWASWRARSHRRPIVLGLGFMVGSLLIGQGLAVATGLASGRTEPVGLAWALVIATLVLYTLSLLATAITGISLLRILLTPPKP